MGAGGRYLSLLFFYIFYIALLGITVPLYLSRRFGFKFHQPVSRNRTVGGVIALALVILVGVFFSDALPIQAQNSPATSGLLKYLLLLLPMSLGTCLQSFHLVPKTVETVLGGRVSGLFVAAFISALSLGLGFFIDTQFAAIELAMIMTILGLLLGPGTGLTRSVYLTYPVLLAVMMVNTLAEAKYFGEPWWALFIGFEVCCMAVIFPFISH